jgi:hypothetical protein
MATGQSSIYNLPYPQVDDDVNVHGDIASLATSLDSTLAGLGLSYMKLDVINTSGASIAAGSPVFINGHNSGQDLTTVGKAIPTTTSPILGLLKSTTANNAQGICVVSGVLPDVNTSEFVAGDILYVKTGGGLTNVRPVGGAGAVAVCAYADASNGVLVVTAKGNGTWGALKNGLS